MDEKNTAIRLFISDLPDTTDSMSPGGVYAMIAETPPARFPIVATSMAGAVGSGTAATLLVPSSPKIFVERLSQVGFPGIEDALDSGHVQIFQFQDDFSKKMFRFGAEAFLSELDHFRLPAESYLIIDQADELLSLHDIGLALEQAEALGHWARKLKVTVLLVFTRLAAVPGSEATLTGLMDYLSGIVRLGGHQDGLDLTFEYWQSADGTVAAKTFGLSILESGTYRIKQRNIVVAAEEPVANTVVAPQPPSEAPQDQRYLYMDPELAAVGQQVAGIWTACESVVQIIRESFGVQAPCVLLVYRRDMPLRELAEAVHTLRLSLGHYARIVIIERDTALRYQNEILLLRLGTSLVIHRDVPENRIPLMLESVRGQVFTREVEMNFEAALASVVTSAKRGYLPPAMFVREIQSIVERAEMLNLPCALVVATPIDTQACIEVLARIQMLRAGDLSTTDSEHCFLFFGGCPQGSVGKAIRSVLGDQPKLFAQTHSEVTRSDIRLRLMQLSEAIQGKVFPDALQAMQAPVVAAPETPPASQTDDTRLPAEDAVAALVATPALASEAKVVSAMLDDMAEPASASTLPDETTADPSALIVEAEAEEKTMAATPRPATVDPEPESESQEDRRIQPAFWVRKPPPPAPRPLRRAVRRFADEHASTTVQGSERE